jgi:DNA-binding NarL/FixJ family response regulator
LAKELLPDIVIMDIMLPTINGAEAAKQIKSACPNTRIILLSTEKDNQYITDSIKAQVNGYLLKNASPKELINAIRMIYAGESVFNLEIVKKIMDMLTTKWTGANTKKSPLVESNSTILNKEVKNG